MTPRSHKLGQLWLALVIAMAAFTPALVARVAHWQLNPIADSAIFGMAILSAGFLLSWAAEAAENYIAQGLILAVVAFITVLPEYAIDIYYAFEAGRSPQSGYTAFAAANMTGANRLLIGLAWPAITLLQWWRTQNRAVQLEPANAIEVTTLGIASLYAFVILWKNSISLVDTVVLTALFGFYLWRVSGTPRATEADEDEDEVGLNAAIATLPRGPRFALMGGLAVVAAGVILAVAEPFAEAMVRTGRALNIDQFLLIQWLAPIVSEVPEFVIATLFVLAGRAGAALIAMIGDKINQWTLLVGMLPLAMTVGAGSLTALPLDARQHEEFFLTAAQSLLGLGLLLRLRLTVAGALALAALFFGQLAVAFMLRGDEVRDIAALTVVAWLYLVLAGLVFAWNWRSLGSIVGLVLAPHTTAGNLRPAIPAPSKDSSGGRSPAD